MSRQGSLATIVVLAMSLFFVGCASNNKRSELRDKVVSQSGFLCEFINGEKHRQVEIELNVLMAKKCDVDKPYSVSNYKTSAEVAGMIFCCNTKEAPTSTSKPAAPSAPVSAGVSATAAATATKTTDKKVATDKKTTGKPTGGAKPAEPAELEIDIEPAK